MPPWLPEPGFAEFAGERRLTAPEIATITRWVRAGAPRGAADGAPREMPRSIEWQLGDPDLVVEFPRYTVPPTGRDIYRNLVVRYPLSVARFVRASELLPGDPGVVHHARLMVDSTPSSREMDQADPGPGFDGMELHSRALNPDGFFVGWTPGRVPYPGDADMAWPIAPGTDLVLQVHLRPRGEPREIVPRLGLYFAPEAPARRPALIMLGSRMIDIPPGESRHVVTDSFTLPVDVEALGVYPHAHYLATEMQGYAVLPGGERRWLIRIRDWDFNWQDEYRYAAPVALPAGSTLFMRYTYDNSARNPQNPSSPPRRVQYGPNSIDEMADLVVQVRPRDPADLAALQRDLNWRSHAEQSVYLAIRARRLGDTALAAGELDAAVEHYREAVLLQADASTHAALARALVLKGDTAQAIAHLERALRLAQESGQTELGVRIRSTLEEVRKP